MKNNKLSIFFTDNQVFNFKMMYGNQSKNKNIEKTWQNVGNAIRFAIDSNKDKINGSSKK